jgi:hypothetical protein
VNTKNIAFRYLTAATLAGAAVATLPSPSFAQTATTTTSNSTLDETTATRQSAAGQTTTTTSTFSSQNSVTTSQTQNGQPAPSSAVVSSAQLAPPTENKGRKGGFGPEVGIYLPVSNKTRNAFGSAWYSVGFGIGRVPRPSRSGQFQADLRLFGVSRSSGRDVIMMPLNLNYRRALGTKDVENAPYVGAGLSLVGHQLHSDPNNVRSRFQGTAGVNFFAGVNFSDRGYFQTRWFQLAPTRGYDLSGLSLATGYRF